MTDPAQKEVPKVPCLRLFKRILGIVLVFASTGIWAASTSPPIGSIAADRGLGASGKVLRIGLETDSEPSYFTNESGQIDGFDYHLGKVLAKKLGMSEAEFVEGDQSQLPQLLRAGEVDIIMGGYVPDDGILGVIWSQGYLDFGVCLIVRQDSFLRNYRQLRNRKVAI